jgi:hypothetical protein
MTIAPHATTKQLTMFVEGLWWGGVLTSLCMRGDFDTLVPMIPLLVIWTGWGHWPWEQ